MTDSVEAEHAALIVEHRELEAEHVQLQNRPDDIAAHRAHADRLRAHIVRLHDYMARRGFQRLKSKRRANRSSHGATTEKRSKKGGV